MHPSSQLIKYLHVVSVPNIKDVVYQKFGIIITDEEVNNICCNLRSFKVVPQNQRMISLYLDRVGLSMFKNRDVNAMLIKFSKNKKRLYFVNTAIHRGIDFGSISELLNSNYSTLEKGLLFTEDEVSFYKEAIFNITISSPEELETFFKTNEGFFDFEEKKSIEQIQIESGLIPTVDPLDVVNAVQSLTHNLFLKNIASPNSDKQLFALQFAKVSIKASAELQKLKGVDNPNNQQQSFLMHFLEDKDVFITKKALDQNPDILNSK